LKKSEDRNWNTACNWGGESHFVSQTEHRRGEKKRNVGINPTINTKRVKTPSTTSRYSEHKRWSPGRQRSWTTQTKDSGRIRRKKVKNPPPPPPPDPQGSKSSGSRSPYIWTTTPKHSGRHMRKKKRGKRRRRLLLVDITQKLTNRGLVETKTLKHDDSPKSRRASPTRQHAAETTREQKRGRKKKRSTCPEDPRSRSTTKRKKEKSHQIRLFAACEHKKAMSKGKQTGEEEKKKRKTNRKRKLRDGNRKQDYKTSNGTVLLREKCGT